MGGSDQEVACSGISWMDRFDSWRQDKVGLMDGIGLLLLYNNLVVNYTYSLFDLRWFSRRKPVVVVCNDYIGSVIRGYEIDTSWCYIRNLRKLNWLNNFENKVKNVQVCFSWLLILLIVLYSCFIRYNVCNYCTGDKIIIQLICACLGSNKADRIIILMWYYYSDILRVFVSWNQNSCRAWSW